MELLEIEKDLKARGENAMREYDGRLLALNERLESALRSGLPRDEFARGEELKAAIVIARKLLRLQVRAAAPE